MEKVLKIQKNLKKLLTLCFIPVTIELQTNETIKNVFRNRGETKK